MIFSLRAQYQKTKALYQKYERVLIPAMLVFGFVMDYVTFKNIQPRTVLTVLTFYFLLAGASIAFIHYYDANRITQKLKFARLFAPLIVQFTFGALLGATFIFYWFSASIASSWPFFVIVSLLMVSNEIFRGYFKRVVIHISVYYFISFSFLSIVLPYAFNSLDARLFILAGVISIIFMYAYVQFLSKAQPRVRAYKSDLKRIVLVIFFGMNALYFSNVIPPIPLSLREAGIYHNVVRSGSNYILQREQENFLQKIVPGKTIHLNPGERAYVYTSIFAPTDLNTKIYHHWQYFDESLEKWLEKDKLSFNITGGRKQGYRGYSSKSALEHGNWRVYARIQSGKTLGRIGFRIVGVDEERVLEEIIR
jgi:hypothetical protein